MNSTKIVMIMLLLFTLIGCKSGQKRFDKKLDVMEETCETNIIFKHTYTKWFGYSWGLSCEIEILKGE